MKKTSKDMRLVKLKDTLKVDFHTEFLADNVLSISFNKDELPFVQLISEETYPDFIIISFSVECVDPALVSTFTLRCNSIAPIATGEVYYIDDNGVGYFGEEAYKRYMFTNNPDLIRTITPENKTFH